LVVLKNRRIAIGDETLMLQSDDFVSKCITFMRLGGAEGDEDAVPTATQARRRTRTLNEDDEDDDDGDALAWDYLGRKACYQNVRRPPVPAFLLGPLSVQKKVRAPTQRQGRLRRDQPATLTKPQELGEEDLERNEKSTLTHKCKEIRDSLHKYVHERSELVEADVGEECETLGIEDPDNDERMASIVQNVLRRHRLATNWEVSLFEYAINPHSFGQTVENFFYISFLVRDGFVKLNYDTDNLPTIRRFASEYTDATRC
jgi:non-structural maintenance of chromosomes element 4